MNIYDAAVHVSIFQNFVCHICYFGDFAEAVESNFAVDPLIAFRGAVFVPAGFNEAGGDGVYADLLGSSSLTRDLVRKWMADLVTP